MEQRGAARKAESVENLDCGLRIADCGLRHEKVEKWRKGAELRLWGSCREHKNNLIRLD
jgi:hypothetical protein